jgi:capsular exopolysaccharide synthesis family protein
MLTGAAIGLAMALAALIILEQTDTCVRYSEEVRRITSGGPIIGSLPPLPRSHRRALKEGHDVEMVTEAFSLARTNLGTAARMALEDEFAPYQVLMVTSGLPGEGKTTTAASLARAFARSGRRVILVDADLRRPGQGNLFPDGPEVGLANVLADEATLEQAIGPTEYDNLEIIHSGETDYSPADLLAQPKVAELIEALRKEADYVILDTPACAVVADALLLAPHVDCIVDVVGLGVVDRDTLRDTTAALEAAGPGFVTYFVNRDPTGRLHRYKYYSINKSIGASLAAATGQAPIRISPRAIRRPIYGNDGSLVQRNGGRAAQDIEDLVEPARSQDDAPPPA